MAPRFVVFIDIDGTLQDSMEGRGDAIRPFASDLLVAIQAAGGFIVAWSGGGKQYAEQAIMRIARQSADPFSAHRAVRMYVGKGSAIALGDLEPLPKFSIDDQDELIRAVRRAGWGTFRVPYYDSKVPDDTALQQALAAIQEWMPKPQKFGEELQD